MMVMMVLVLVLVVVMGCWWVLVGVGGWWGWDGDGGEHGRSGMRLRACVCDHTPVCYDARTDDTAQRPESRV
jgi:hypothetical protein